MSQEKDDPRPVGTVKPPSSGSGAEAAREARLAQALRANLRRRKAAPARNPPGET